MFSQLVAHRHPALFEAAAALHQDGLIGPDTWVIDYATVVANAARIADTCRAHAITPWFISKQIARCPQLIRGISKHLPLATAVDVREATIVQDCGVALANVGHLVQIPRRQLPRFITSEHVTVYDSANLGAVADAAGQASTPTKILLKITGPDAYPGQEGGLRVKDVNALLDRAAKLPTIRVVGVTGFPCVLYDPVRKEPRLTETAHHVLEAADILRNRGIDRPVVSLPSHSSCSTIPLVAAAGGTVVEPGHALTGTTPQHADNWDLTELPAMVYVSEIVQTEPVPALAGGGFYARGHARTARLRNPGQADIHATLCTTPADNIDYYRRLKVPDGVSPELGATALMAFRAQLFTTRSAVAVIADVSATTPRLLGLYDSMGNALPEGML